MLLSELPSKLYGVPLMKEYETPEVNSEHWVMRQLGCPGTIPYEDKIKGCFRVGMTMKPHPLHKSPWPRSVELGAVLPEVLQDHVDKSRKQSSKYPKHICWIGLQLGDINRTPYEKNQT